MTVLWIWVAVTEPENGNKQDWVMITCDNRSVSEIDFMFFLGMTG